MADATLLSNGRYHVMVTAAGSGVLRAGAYGFRDQLQDVMALVHCEPWQDHARRRRRAPRGRGDVRRDVRPAA